MGSQFKDTKNGTIKTIKKYEGDNVFIEDKNMMGRLFQWTTLSMKQEILNKQLIPTHNT